MSLKDESIMENVCGNHSYRQELPDFSVEVFSGFILIINIYNTLLRLFIAVLWNLTSSGMRYVRISLIQL